MKNTVRLNFEFPRKEYPYLKMMCAKKNVSLRAFASKLLIKEIEEFEDRLLAKEAQEVLDDIESGKEEVISLEEFTKELDIDL